MKQCSKCKKVKPIFEFHKAKYTKDKHDVYCKKCSSENAVIERIKRKAKFNSLYGIWANIKQRCSNPNATAYKYYGGRGITVCRKWIGNFLNFYNWAISNGHKRGLTIDRRNNDGNYTPENCHFVTMAENIRNNSTTKLNGNKVKQIRKLLEKGKLTQREIGRIFGVGDTAISRINIGKNWVGVSEDFMEHS